MADSSLVTYEFYGPAWAHGGEQPSINIGVMHDVEAPIIEHMIRSLIGPNYFGKGGDGPSNPVSIHYGVGPDDICQGTPEHIIPWHVGNSNAGTIGFEQCDYASLTQGQWMDPEGLRMLANSAKLMADISRRHPLIRLRWLSDAEALYALDHKTSPGGWVTHRQLSRIGRSTGHTDPGANYPLDYVMNLAQNGTPAPTPIPIPIPTPTQENDDMYSLYAYAGKDGNGSVFAGSPGRFFHVSDGNHLALCDGTLWNAGSIKYVDNPGDLDIIRDNCIGNGQDKGNNFTSVLPSSFVLGKAAEPGPS